MGRGRPKKISLPPLNLSKYSEQEKLPPNIINIIKNALIIHNGDIERVSELYQLPEEKISFILEENYLTIAQIIDSKMKSKELDAGIDSAITLMTNHVKEIKKNQKEDEKLLRDSTVSQLTRLSDRFINLKAEYTKTFDTLVTKALIQQSFEERKVQVLENGKPIDDSEYKENQNTVAKMMETYINNKKDKKVTLVNIKTYEIKIFEGDSAKIDAEQFLGCQGHLSDLARQKSPYKGEWLVQYEGKEPKYTNREY